MKAYSIFATAILALGSMAAHADQGDSSAIDAAKVTSAVQNSTGVMMRVPIDASGREYAASTELRVINANGSDTSATNLPNLWNNALDVSKVPQKDSSTSDNGDSSTHWGWNRYYYGGWNNSYYYNWYTPSYYYGGYTYIYNNPYYYNYYSPYYYGGYNYYGYRYYYYYRGW